MARYVYNNGKIDQVDKQGNVISNKVPITNLKRNSNITTTNSKKENTAWDKTGATLGNTLLLLGKGIVDKGEQALDWANDMSAKANSALYKLLGRDDLAKQETESAKNFIKRDLTSELGEKTGASRQITKNEQNGSLLTRDNLGGQVVQAVGGMIPTLLIGKAAGIGELNAALNASKMGTLTKVGTSALINAPTNAMLASSSYGGALEEAYLNGATEAEATKYAIGSTAVEIASEWITGGVPGTNGKGGLDSLTEKGIEKISNKLVKDLTKYGYQMIGEGVEEGIAEIMSPILKNATYSKDENVDWNNVINSAIIGGITSGIIEAPITINNIMSTRNQSNNANTSNNVLPTARTRNSLSENIESNNNLTNGNLYQYTETNNEKINNLRKSAVEVGKFVNNEKTNGVMNVAEKLISDKNYNIVFDNTITNENGNMVNARITTLENGETEIRLNPNSDRAAEFLLIHEVSHGIKTQEMIDLVNDYASKNPEFNQAVKSLEQLYGKDLTSEEVFADVCGQLFGKQEFIMNLSTSKPSLFRRIYNKIVELANKITGNSNEALFIKDLKNKWETAYRTQNNNLDGTNYSFMSEKGLNNALQTNKNNINVENRLSKAKQLKQQGLDNESIRQRTLWFQDPNGKWLFEITDKDAKITKQLQPNKKYNLSDIFTHDKLFEAYPELKKMKIKTINIKPSKSGEKYGGQYDPLTKTLELNNNYINKKETIRNILLHEIQHRIQTIEKLEKGDVGKNLIRYYTSLGEIQSSEVETRSNMDYAEIKANAPEISKANPVHPLLKKIHNEPNSKTAIKAMQNKDIAKLYNEIYNKGVKGEYNRAEINKKGDIQTKKSTKKGILYNNGRWGNNINSKQKSIQIEEGLDNSSFSYDNQGRNLTKKQHDYFKDSKVRDEEGKLITVYHTMTGRGPQFNEFNPVGTDYYKFGNQVVNYYTNSKEMSGSYADQEYTMADTNKVSSIEEVKKLINEYTKDTQYEGVELEKKDNKYMIVDNALKKAYPKAKEAYDKFTNEEKTNMYNVLQSVRAYIDRGYEGDFILLDKKTDAKLDEIRSTLETSEEREIFDELRKTKGQYFINDIKSLYEFENKDELLKKIKESLQIITGKQQSNYQYEGYVNITNPYIIDAEGRNWNKIESKKDSTTTEKMIYMDSLTKDRLIQLAADSKNRYEKTFAEYQKWLDATNSIDGNLREQNPIEIRSANRVFREVFADGVKEFINNDYNDSHYEAQEKGLSKIHKWRTNNDIISKMHDWDLITESEYSEFQKTLEVPNDVREKLKELSNQKVKYNEYDADGRNPVVKESTLLDIWEKYQEASRLYFDNGRYEYSLFDNQLLDGYLKDELKSSFPVRDEFGVNDETLKDLYKVALNNFDEKYIRSEYNEWSVTNDIVKKIIELNKFGENYDGVIIKNTVDYGGKSKTKNSNDLYITFNSNQFKAVDNTNPTTDPDIRYSQEGNEWQGHLEKNYKATGTRTKFSDMKSNVPEQADTNNTKTQIKKVKNPLEISKLTKEDANTTPILKKINVSTGDGESKFASNIRNKTDMLSESSKDTILSNDDVRFYEKVTNKESLEKAFERLNKNGKSETESWLRKESENATSVDVAEGWILLKQYQDSIAKETDINTKNELNRSMVEVAKKLREMGTKAGQTVQAFNILNRLTPEGMVYYAQSELSEAYEKMSQNKTKEWIDSNRDRFELTPEETQFIMDTMNEAQQMEDGYDKRVKLAEIQKVMTDKLPPERGAGIKAWMRISMLFNPKTQVRNVMGNAIIAPVNSFSDLFASYVDKQIAKKTGIRTTGKTNLNKYKEGFKTGLYQSYNDFKKGINTRNMQGNRFEVTQGKSFNDNSAIGKKLNKIDSLLSFMLDAGDRGFYEASFTNSINNQMILNNTTEVTQDMIDIATSEALSRTWQDNNNYTKFVLQTRNALNKINIKGYGLGDVLIPFAKTPANLTKAIVDYSPLGMINAINSGRNLKNSLSNGQYNAKMQHQFVQNLGKATAGTMLYVLGYALAKAGITSGESDEDKDVKDFMKNTLGVSSYSIKIGDKTFTYDWAQPIAAPLSIMANIVNKQKEGATLTENIVSSLDTAGNILLEQSFMESINTVLNNNDGIVSGIQEAMLELPSRAIPTLMKQIVDLTDDTQRTSFEYDKPLQTAVNKVKAKIPGLSKTLSPVVDTMGREVQRYGGKNNIFNVFLNPANVNTENISESAQEIYKVYKATGDKTVMPRVIPYYFDEKGAKRTLTSKERSEFQKISGQIIEENVANLINNSNYVNLSDIDKSSVLNNLVNYAYNKARYEMFGTEMSNLYNKVNEWTKQGGSVSDYYANKEENDYSLENSKKYNTMTAFNLSYSDYNKYSQEINAIKEQYNDTNSRKYAVWQYIQNQNLTKVQKILLYHLSGGYSISNYQDYLFNYLNNQNITKKEKQEIWNYLYK